MFEELQKAVLKCEVLFIISLAVAGVCEDVFLIWKELEEARSTVRQVQQMLSESDQSASQDGIIYVSFIRNTATMVLMISIFCGQF